jgi:hypothetical protein
MALVLPTPAQAAVQTPINVFSPASTPLANTTNGLTYVYLPTKGVWSLAEGGTVTSIGTGLGLLGGPIVSSGTIDVDYSYLNTVYVNQNTGTVDGGIY